MKKSKSTWWFFLLFLASLLVLAPLMRSGFFVSDDGEWMIIRLSAFFQSLREGQFPVRFLGRLNHSYGYPVANFLYPGFLYLGSLIHALGFPFVETTKIILALSVVGSALAAFWWLRVYFSVSASVLGTFGFLFSPYLLFDLYTRGSVGEVLAFLPAFGGFYSIATKKRWLFALSVALLVVSHNTLALMFLGIFSLFLFWRGAFEFFPALALGLGIAGFFWLPALFERRFVIFDSTVVSRPLSYLVTQKDTVLLGFVAIVSALLLFLRKDTMKLAEKNFFLLVFSVSIIVATPLATGVWTWETLGKLVQFPYRFLAISVVASTWIIASLFQTVSGRSRLGLLVLFAVLWIFTLWSSHSSIIYINQPEGYYTTNEATTNVADEYMPIWVIEKPQKRAGQKLEFVVGRGTIESEKATSQHVIANITAREEGIVRVNTVYYPGWGVLVDGTPTKIDHENREGLIQVKMPVGTHTLRAEFRETPARLLSDLVSVGSLITLAALALRDRRRRTR